MSTLVALVTTVAVARSPHHPNAATAPATQLHGAEATDATNANAAHADPTVANVPPKATPPVIPLEALPIDKTASPAPKHVTNASNRGHARAARTVSSSLVVKKAAPSKKILAQKTTRTR